jgi:hypothetical protein
VALFVLAVGFGVWAAIPQLPLAAVLVAILAAYLPFSLIEAAAHRRSGASSRSSSMPST